jgi:hypothetical protein
MSTPDYTIRIDPERKEIELYGVRYALGCFEVLGLGQPGDAFEILKREDGVLTLQRLHLRTGAEHG